MVSTPLPGVNTIEWWIRSKSLSWIATKRVHVFVGNPGPVNLEMLKTIAKVQYEVSHVGVKSIPSK